MLDLVFHVLQGFLLLEAYALCEKTDFRRVHKIL